MFPNPNNFPNKAAYRLQLPPNCVWTEWRDIEIPIKEPYILSLQVTETCTKEQLEEFYKQIKT